MPPSPFTQTLKLGVSPFLFCAAQNIPSSTRIIAALSGFLTFTQHFDRPDLYGRSRRWDTMPSRLWRLACNDRGALTDSLVKQQGFAVPAGRVTLVNAGFASFRSP